MLRSKTFSNLAIFLNENAILFEQNNKKATRRLIKTIVVDTTKILSYKNIVKMQRKRNTKIRKSKVNRDR